MWLRDIPYERTPPMTVLALPCPATRSMDIPQELLDRAAKPVLGAMTNDKLGDHFALVHHQLYRLRAAVAVAVITGRAVVLPPIWCQLDKYWAPLHNGGLAGGR